MTYAALDRIIITLIATAILRLGEDGIRLGPR